VSTLIALIVGIILGFAFLLWTRKQPDAGRRLYVIGLAVTALIYVVFALIGRAGARSLALEALGVLLYGAVAWVGFRKSAVLLALGWAMHVVWDVSLHLQGAGAEYTPDWYPWSCVSFDLMVAGAVLSAGLLTPATAEEAPRSPRSQHPLARAQSRAEPTGEAADTPGFRRR
jgi:hypothetical protein